MPQDVDISSYKLPEAPNPLDVAGKLGSLQQQKIGIDQSKLKLMNDRYSILNKELSTLMTDPDVQGGTPAAPQKVLQSVQNLVKLGIIPGNMSADFIKQIPANPKLVPQFLQQTISRAQDINSAVNTHYGVPGELDTGNSQVPVTRSSIHGLRRTGEPIPTQIPPTATALDPKTKEPRLQGVQPPDVVPGSGVALPPMRPDLANRLPVAPRTGMPPADVTTTGPYNQPALPKSQSRVVDPNAPIQPKLVTTVPYSPRGPVTGFAPGVAQAENEAGGASGQALAKSRDRAANYQRDLFPLTQAIPALEKLGTKGTGPGTETINNLKSFVISNVPGVTEQMFDGTVKDYDKAKKYLTDFVNQTGNSGTNDKLAAAFAGNPSVGISNAAAVDVAKAALALRKMQQALHLEFERAGLPANEFSKWTAKRNGELDPRAFGVEMMSSEAKKKLYAQLDKNKAEGKKFDDSLQLAHTLGLISK